MKRVFHNGFTLVELLVVVVIVGIMAMMLGPTFTTGSDIARVKTAARGVMQMSRYARTMAVLNQRPVALVLSADGSMRVERVGAVGSGQSAMVSGQSGGGSGQSAMGSGQAAIGNGQAASGSGQSASGSGQAANGGELEAGDGKAYVMADLEAEKSYAQVLFDVTLDDFDVDESESASKGLFEEQDSEKGLEAGEEVKVVKTARILYESNGRCLPFRVVVRAAGDDVSTALTVAVDRFGVARVLEEAL